MRQAQALNAEGLRLARAIGSRRWTAYALTNLGWIPVEQGHEAQAQAYLEEGMALLSACGHKREVMEGVEGLALVALRHPPVQEGARRAARLFGAAAAQREATNAPVLGAYRRLYDHAVISIRAELDEATFTADWMAGQAMTLEQVIAYALENKRGGGVGHDRGP